MEKNGIYHMNIVGQEGSLNNNRRWWLVYSGHDDIQERVRWNVLSEGDTALSSNQPPDRD